MQKTNYCLPHIKSGEILWWLIIICGDYRLHLTIVRRDGRVEINNDMISTENVIW